MERCHVDFGALDGWLEMDLPAMHALPLLIVRRPFSSYSAEWNPKRAKYWPTERTAPRDLEHYAL